MLTNYILVDYENIQNIDLGSIKDKNIYIKMFVGSKQNNLPTDLVVKSQQLGNQIEWIQIIKSGKNALDFHLAFVLGNLIERDPKAFFHIISKDTGYDPLIAYIEDKKLKCKRSDDISLVIKAIQLSTQTTTLKAQLTESKSQSVKPKSKLTISKEQLPTSNQQAVRTTKLSQYDLVLKSLISINKDKRPKSEKSLKNHIKTHLGLESSNPSINKIYQQLLGNQKLSLDQANKIDYKF